MRLTHRGERWLRACGVAAALGMTTVEAQGQLEPSAARTQSPSGPSEGITVHGHWKIVVRNPDGSIASSREFENALTEGASSGQASLASLLARTTVPGKWSVVLAGPNGPCLKDFTAPQPCSAVEGVEIIGFSLIKTNPSPTSLQLSGSVMINGSQSGGGINSVETTLELCNSSLTPLQCVGDVFNSSGKSFSRATLNSAINVARGQIVQFTVTFTFS